MYEKGYSQIWIARKLKVKKQIANYSVKNQIEMVQNRRKKLESKYIQRIIELAENQTISSISSWKIASIINNELKKDEKNIFILKATVYRILNKKFGKLRKLRKVFFLNEKKRGLNFAKKFWNFKFLGQVILFIDETKIEMSSYSHEKIRLSHKTQENLMSGEENIFALINRLQKNLNNLLW